MHLDNRTFCSDMLCAAKPQGGRWPALCTIIVSTNFCEGPRWYRAVASKRIFSTKMSKHVVQHIFGGDYILNILIIDLHCFFMFLQFLTGVWWFRFRCCSFEATAKQLGRWDAPRNRDGTMEEEEEEGVACSLYICLQDLENSRSVSSYHYGWCGWYFDDNLLKLSQCLGRATFLVGECLLAKLWGLCGMSWCWKQRKTLSLTKSCETGALWNGLVRCSNRNWQLTTGKALWIMNLIFISLLACSHACSIHFHAHTYMDRQTHAQTYAHILDKNGSLYDPAGTESWNMQIRYETTKLTMHPTNNGSLGEILRKVLMQAIQIVATVKK